VIETILVKLDDLAVVQKKVFLRVPSFWEN